MVTAARWLFDLPPSEIKGRIAAARREDGSSLWAERRDCGAQVGKPRWKLPDAAAEAR